MDFDCGENSVCIEESPDTFCKSKCEIADENPCLANDTICVHEFHYLMGIVCESPPNAE